MYQSWFDLNQLASLSPFWFALSWSCRQVGCFIELFNALFSSCLQPLLSNSSNLLLPVALELSCSCSSRPAGLTLTSWSLICLLYLDRLFIEVFSKLVYVRVLLDEMSSWCNVFIQITFFHIILALWRLNEYSLRTDSSSAPIMEVNLELFYPLIKTARMSQLTSQLVLQLVAQLSSSYCASDLICTQSLCLYSASHSITALGVPGRKIALIPTDRIFLGGVHELCHNSRRLSHSSNTNPIRQSGPRPDSRLLRQTALEVLTRSARSDSPRKTRPERNSGEVGRRRRRTAAAVEREGEGGG
ncbi:hypothetical protein F511_25593 [Dorcoceras hygrometricum]|uniref:Uncharacterized protein n=1 Tax=Dorcoceras hygrometricum TaxID=472368 RepID=A0A2Z7D0V5_9LAMI|nr:hypothetical protein F511_25593 [Dorcoceras hygrometricum]